MKKQVSVETHSESAIDHVAGSPAHVQRYQIDQTKHPQSSADRRPIGHAEESSKRIRNKIDSKQHSSKNTDFTTS